MAKLYNLSVLVKSYPAALAAATCYIAKNIQIHYQPIIIIEFNIILNTNYK